LPATPMLRREQIKLQVALITPLLHLKGYGAPETKSLCERPAESRRRFRGFVSGPEICVSRKPETWSCGDLGSRDPA
jgi:hypothetical protein